LKVGPVLSQLLADKSLDEAALSKIIWIANQYNEAPMRKRLPDCIPVDIPAGCCPRSGHKRWLGAFWRAPRSAELSF